MLAASCRRGSRRQTSHRVGSPVASSRTQRLGAIVKLALRLGTDSLQPFTETTSSADGTFDFGVQPAAVFVVSAADATHAAVQKTIVLADPRVKPDQLVLELADCRAHLSGLVRDAGGGAIANAHLATAGTSGADSDRTGRYNICLTPNDAPGPSTTSVRVDADGYGSVAEQISVVGELHHDFVLAPEAILIGRVMVGNQPVFGARVTATPDISERAHRVVGSWAESDRDGHFRIGGLAPGRFQLEAFGDHIGTSTPIPAIARSAATSHEIRLAVTAFARIRGRVVMDGAPVAGAAVAVATNAPSQPSTASISQADGSFVLDRVPYGSVKLVAPPYDVRTPTSVAVAVATIDGVELEVGKLKMMHGHVTRKGKPVAGAGIDCLGNSTQADADGAYVLEGLSTSQVSCSAWDRDAGAFATPPSIQLAVDDTTFDFELDSAGEVKGTIVDEAGSGVAGAYVQLDLVNGGDDFCEAVADPSGVFDCTMLSGGEYVATVTPSPGARQPFAPASSGGFGTIRVPRDGVTSGVTLAIKNQRLAIRGTVVDDTGSSVADVSVEVVAAGRGSMFLPQTISDTEGRFEIDDLAPGTYTVHAHAADGSENELAGVASGSSAVTITLARPGEIDGTLVGFSSTPVVRARMFTADLLLGTDAIVDGDTFVASGLKPGRYTVEAQAGAEADGDVIDVRSNEVTHVTLTSRGVGKVAGRVAELGTDAPVAGMRCDGNLSMGGQMSVAPPDETRQAFTDSDGRFIVNAPLGRARVFCFLPNSGALSPAGTDVDVTSNAVPSVELFAVRPSFGATPGNAGFGVTPNALPLTVNQVDPKGPAAASGLLVGDVIVTIDGISLQGVLPIGARTLVMNHHPGSVLMLGIERGGATRTLSIIVGN
jgi:hypothetical protein